MPETVGTVGSPDGLKVVPATGSGETLDWLDRASAAEAAGVGNAPGNGLCQAGVESGSTAIAEGGGSKFQIFLSASKCSFWNCFSRAVSRDKSLAFPVVRDES